MRASNERRGLNAKSGDESDMQRDVASRAEPITHPTIVAVSAVGCDAIRIELQIPNNLCYFEGHFPGCSLLPGVVQVNWAVHFGRQHFSLPARFTYLSQVKFMRVITPGSPVTLTLEFAAARGELSFTYQVVDALCSSGKIGFV